MRRSIAVILLAIVSCAASQSAAGDGMATLAKAAGLRPMADGRADAGDELRIWLFSNAVLQEFVVLREGAAGVRGDLWLWWGSASGVWRASGEAREKAQQRISESNAGARRWIKSRWNCGKHVIQPLFEVCRVSFREQPNWSALLRDLERQGIWDLADGSTLKSELKDGVTLVVEVRRAGSTRTYSYANPDHLPGPDAHRAERIVSFVQDFVRALERKGSTPTNPSIQSAPAKGAGR